MTSCTHTHMRYGAIKRLFLAHKSLRWQDATCPLVGGATTIMDGAYDLLPPRTFIVQLKDHFLPIKVLGGKMSHAHQ
jgi:hypothetical protein